MSHTSMTAGGVSPVVLVVACSVHTEVSYKYAPCTRCLMQVLDTWCTRRGVRGTQEPPHTPCWCCVCGKKEAPTISSQHVQCFSNSRREFRVRQKNLQSTTIAYQATRRLSVTHVSRHAHSVGTAVRSTRAHGRAARCQSRPCLGLRMPQNEGDGFGVQAGVDAAYGGTCHRNAVVRLEHLRLV